MLAFGARTTPGSPLLENPRYRILSLGAGVQSSCLRLTLPAEGLLPRIDFAVADTVWEPRAVYDHLDRLERNAAELDELEDGVVNGCSPRSYRGEESEPGQDDFGLAS
uniref:Uncharacterized protein n=1 Tax=Streptomyces sp. NBC_00049 TaxID=2903617 RepID=A0AAU2K4T9_9ACTN